MDPNKPGPEDYGHGDYGHDDYGRGDHRRGDYGRDYGSSASSSGFGGGSELVPRSRPPRESLAADFGQSTPAPARTVRLVSGDFLLTVNPVDGSEIEPCPPAQRPGSPLKFTATARAAAERAARPPVPPGPARPVLPLLARAEERARLVRLLARGRSVCLTGPSGSGRTALLDLVAEDCADLAPDGVVRLSGFNRTAGELLHDLFHAVYDAPLHRPARAELLALVGEIGAVVVLDDIEFGGAALDELIAATPECALLIAATPEVPAPSPGSLVEEVFLGGLDRAAGRALLERTAGRVLTEEEANWAGDLWFESEGLPLRFVQAGALLRQRDRLRASAGAVDEFGVFEDVRAAPRLPVTAETGDNSSLGSFDTAGAADEVALPSLGQAAAPAPLLASRLSASARATLRLAVALDGEVPHQAHLPALIGDTHADAALGELAGCGLISPVGSRYRLAAGVQLQLEAAGYAAEQAGHARHGRQAGYAGEAGAEAVTAVQHYAWWASHPSVTPQRVCAEAETVLAALAVLVPQTTPSEVDEEAHPVLGLARAAAPAFASGLHWGAWEQALRLGAEAAALAGDVEEQAYFHHELGVLALCGGQLELARAELEVSVGLRGVLADRPGAVAGRRALALVADRAGDTPLGGLIAGEDVPDARHDESATPPAGVPAAFPSAGPRPGDTLPTQRIAAPLPAHPSKSGRRLRELARRNAVAAGSAVLLAAVLGTVVTLGMTSHDSTDHPSGTAGVTPSAPQGTDDGNGQGGDTPGNDSGAPGGVTGTSAAAGPDGIPGTSDDPAPTPTPSASVTAGPSDLPTGTTGTTGTHGSGGQGPSSTPSRPSSPSRPPTSPTPTSKPSPSKPSSPAPSSTPSDSDSPPTSPTPNPPSTSGSAGSTVSGGPVGRSGSASPDGAGTASPDGAGPADGVGSPDGAGSPSGQDTAG